jgi:aldose sugar dehydrogenase
MVIKNRLLLQSITAAAAVIGTISLLFFLYLDNNDITNQRYDNNDTSFPVLRSPYDESLKIQLVAKGLSHPTSMAFVGGRGREGGREGGENNANNILVTEKNGTLRLISGGLLNPQPVLKLNVNALAERGLLGVAAAAASTTAVTNTTNTTTINHDNNNNNKRGMGSHSSGNNNSSTSNSDDGGVGLVSNNTDADTHAYDKKYDIFLYYTQAEPLRNRVYEYQWNGKENTKLVNPKLILDLPAKPGPYHQGGKLKLSQDNKFLYTVIGDLTSPNTKLQNNKHGKNPYDTSVILKMNLNNISSATSTIRINMTGQASSSSSSSPPPLPHINGGSNVSSNNNGINNNNNNNNNSNYSSYYFAYGIRNSFGLAIDPVTGNVWDTENGPSQYDEINYVRPGFNSGWKIIMGPISRNEGVSVDQLVNFPGSKYADPVISWKKTPAITGIEFLKSSKLGQKYLNNVFVGDYKNGDLYYFEVNSQRNGFKFDNATQAGLADLVVDDKKDQSSIIFGQGFGGISDIKTGPDGLLYIVSIENGVIYKVHQATS